MRDTALSARHGAVKLTDVLTCHFKPAFGKGRALGSRNKRTQLAEHLKCGEAGKIARRIIEGALNGATFCLKLAADRLWPQRAAQPAPFPLPPLTDMSDIPLASAGLIGAVSRGEIGPRDAESVGALLTTHVKVIETTVLAERMEALEARLDRLDV